MKRLFLLLTLIVAFSISCEKSGVNDPSKPVYPQSSNIATYEEQLDAITASLPSLQSTLDKLNDFVGSIGADSSSAVTRGDSDKITGVKAYIQVLEERIEALEEYVANGDAAQRDWLEATYATLDMYEDTINALASLQVEVEALKGEIAASEEKMREQVASSIEKSVDSMKSWVNELLTGYYDIAEIDAMFALIESTLTAADDDIRKEITSLREALSEEFAEMEQAYNDAIKSAIDENNGVLNEKLTSEIKKVNDRIDEEIATLNQRIDDIEERLTKLEGSVSDLLKRIQSIAYVPINEDGKARVTFPNDDTSGATLQLDFMISPKDAAVDLANVYQEAVSIQVFYTGSPLMVAMPIISCEAVATQGLFSVICACDDISMEFYNGDVTARAIMYISDGNNDLTSEYITIVPNRTQIQNNQIWYNVSNRLPVEINQGSGPRIVSNEYDSVAGHYVVTFESDIYAIPASYFGGCSELTSVVLPNCVMTIEAEAFANCYSLTSITLSNSLSYIDSRAFAYASLNSLTLPSSLSGVASDAFLNSNISRLEGDCVADDGISLIFDNSLVAIAPAGLDSEYVVPAIATAIGDAVFNECYNLSHIDIHDKVTSIGNEAFSNCTSLSNITIPDGVESLGDEVFSGCSNLSTITIGAGVTSIVDGLFSNLGKLTDITIGSGVTTIGSCAFSNCTSLSNITIPDGVESLGDEVFSGCSALQSIKIGANVESINSGMFSGCDSIEEFSGKFASEDGYTLIHNNNLVVFAKACGIEEYTIPEYVTHIEERAFANCSDISLFTFKSTTPPTLGADVFEGIDNLQISIPVEAIEAYLTCDWPYEYRRAIVELADINNIPDSCRLYYTTNDNQKLNNYPEDGYSVLSHTYADGQGMVVFYSPLTSIGDGAFCDCGKLTSVTIPDSVTSIGEGAFLWCSSLKSVNIPDRVTSIGNGAFHSCSSLTSETIPDRVTSIGEGAFRGCSSLASVNIPDSVTSIGGGAFFDCGSITSINIPDSVTSIGGSTFEGCSSLTSVTIPNRVTSIGEGAFRGCSSLTSINIPDSVTSIGDCAFSNCSRLTSVTIPESVVSIGRDAFSYCSSLTSITIPDSVTSIGNAAFFFCSSLTSLNIPNSVTTIGDSTFCACSSLTSVTIPDSVTMIGNSAFEYCYSLTSVTIPDGVTTIGDYAFGNCYSLTSVTIPDGVTSIGNWVFANCSSLTSITIPDSVTSIGEYAFYNCSSLTSVYCTATTPPAGYSSMFPSDANDLVIYVPRDYVYDYQTADAWSSYADSIVGYDFENNAVVE